MKKILVTGGCGFIGSHTVVDLIENGFEVISADNLSNADGSALDGIERITGVRVQNYEIDLADRTASGRIFEEHPDLSGIIHFAAFKAVGDSVEQPLEYFHNNLNSLLTMLHYCVEYQIGTFIFSSSCSVYGNSEELPVTEQTPLRPAESPYARTKQIGEEMIRDFSRRYPQVNSVLLRYFNPAGAHPSVIIGESSRNAPTNLVPVITETAIGKRNSMTVFGDDYNTRDGSCVRDYIHVMDLADAHTKCLQYLLAGKNEHNCEVFNVGIGDGVTVLEAVKAFEEVSGQALNYELGPRRPGDVESIYADYGRAARQLGWEPKYSIRDIMDTAWRWEQVRSR